MKYVNVEKPILNNVINKLHKEIKQDIRLYVMKTAWIEPLMFMRIRRTLKGLFSP